MTAVVAWLAFAMAAAGLAVIVVVSVAILAMLRRPEVQAMRTMFGPVRDPLDLTSSPGAMLDVDGEPIE